MRVAQAVLAELLTVAFWAGAQETITIRADVNLVELHARVVDAAGRPVADLTKDAFRLLIDDVPQAITVFHGEDAPVTAGIVIDNSASMAPKRGEVIAAALAFARAGNPKDQMFVVHFNAHARLGLPGETPFTGDISELQSGIAAFELGGTTAFYDALLMAGRHFPPAAYPRKVLLTITDGGDNSSAASLTDALHCLLKSGVVVYSVGIFDENDRDRNPSVLSRIAEQTGGQAFFPGHVSEVKKICTGIAEEIRKQYTLGFAGAEDGRYHRIRLVVKDSRNGPLAVQTRSGYWAVKLPEESGPK